MKRVALVLAFIVIAAFLVRGSLSNTVQAARPNLNTGGVKPARPDSGQAAEPLPAVVKSQSDSPAKLALPTAPNVVLLDQYNNDLGNGIVSANRTDNPTFSAEAADDFVVPAGETWQINQLDVRARVGFPNPTSFNVTIYTESGTLPGTPVYTANNLAVGGTNPDYVIILTTPANLAAGTYWVSVQGNIVGANWYWQGRSVLNNNSTAWREGGAYGTGCTSWTRLTTCAGFSWPGQMFRLNGTIGGGGSPTSTVGPTNTTVPTTAVPTTAVPTTAVPTTAVPTTAVPTTAVPTSTSTSTAVVSVTVQPSATTGTCSIEFSDIPVGHTFYDNVRCLACRGIVSGYADGTFKPNNQVTRGQLAKMVSNAAGFTDDPNPQIFADVQPGHTFYEWINRLTRRGHMTGYNCGGPGEPCVNNMPYFRPFANATRGQTSKIVANAAGFTETHTGRTFEDVPPTHTFYQEIQRLASRNVMGGYPCGSPGEPCVGAENRPYFRPQNDVTRGQSAKIVANTFYPGCVTP